MRRASVYIRVRNGDTSHFSGKEETPVNDYSHFLSPVTIRGRIWKNRSVAAPMGGVEAENGKLTEHAKYFIDYYTQGDLAEYIVGETDISRVGSRSPEGQYFDVREPENQTAMRECAERIHAHDVIATIELCHCGATKIGSPGSPVWGPSEYVRESDGVHVHGMTEAEIRQTIREFTEAAKIAQNCGFDGVCIHAGHEWLPHQFLSRRTNSRTDRFGGSPENRVRFLVMAADAIREVCGEDFIVECRVSGSENEPGDPGYSLDEACEMFGILSKHIDILHVSAGRYYDPVETRMMSCTYQPHGCNVDAAAAIKRHCACPVAVVGGINDPAMCEGILAEGKADFIVMGRQRLADPLFVQKCERGLADEIRPCIRCMRCFPGPMEHVIKEMLEDSPPGRSPQPGGFPAAGKMPEILEQLTRCTVNPEYRHGMTESFPAPEKKKRILVIGGGCAGMQAAITATKRGHSVTLIEKSARLGGILNFAEFDENKYDLFKLARAMEAELRCTDADIQLNTAFSPELLAELGPDVVIDAVGSVTADKGVPGLGERFVLSATDAYQPHMAFGNHAVVIGGGQTGCETAEHIARTGTRVTLIAKHDRLCPDAFRLHGIKLRQLLEERGVEVRENTVCAEARPDGVFVRDTQTGAEGFLSADCIVNALGMKPADSSAIEAACTGLEFYKIGDCAAARNICDATEEGFLTALKL